MLDAFKATHLYMNSDILSKIYQNAPTLKTHLTSQSNWSYMKYNLCAWKLNGRRGWLSRAHCFSENPTYPAYIPAIPMSVPLNDRDTFSCWTSLQTEFNEKVHKPQRFWILHIVTGYKEGRYEGSNYQLWKLPHLGRGKLRRAPGYTDLKGLPGNYLQDTWVAGTPRF